MKIVHNKMVLCFSYSFLFVTGCSGSSGMIRTETDVRLKDPRLLYVNFMAFNSLLKPARDMVAPIQAQVLPENSTIIVIGDIHGDANSLRYDIQQIRAAGYIKENSLLLNDNCYIVFTGDYTDRGLDGIEVWNILSTLKAQNRERVFPLRGNHEDNSREGGFLNRLYGFEADIESQVADGALRQDLWQRINQVYPMLTQALFLGVKRRGDGIIDYPYVLSREH